MDGRHRGMDGKGNKGRSRVLERPRVKERRHANRAESRRWQEKWQQDSVGGLSGWRKERGFSLQHGELCSRRAEWCYNAPVG